jgi:hypothetical protein
MSWRDVGMLRIRDESRAVAKFVEQLHHPLVGQPIQVSITMQARDSFYLCYIDNPLARCWKFLQSHYEPGAECPPHLDAAINALTLAYLWHDVGSVSAFQTAVQCYGQALKETRGVLRDQNRKIPRTTLLAALILDIVEKILCSQSGVPSAHVDGALALVKAIGFTSIQSSPDFPVLLTLTNQSMIASLASRQPIDADIVSWRTEIEGGMSSAEHPRGITGLFVRYAQMQHRFATRKMDISSYVWDCQRLDAEIASLELHMPLFWQYRRVEVGPALQERFGEYCHVYTHRNICQARNLQRVCRLLLNEAVRDYAPAAPPNDNGVSLSEVAQNNIDYIARQICMSVAPWAYCRQYEKRKKPSGEGAQNAGPCSEHSSMQRGDCHTLVFPLYAAAKASASGQIRSQVLDYLYHLADHFAIRNAKMVAQLLEQEVCPDVWDVYARLGSYAFHM